MDYPFVTPVMLNLAGRRVVVIGATTVAAERADELRRAGADVVGHDALGADADIDATLEGAWLVFAATGSAVDDAAVVHAAGERRIWANAHDRTDLCAFQMPAILRRGPLTVAVGTSGAVPTLAVRLRDHIAAEIPAEVVAAIEAAAQIRADAKAAGRSPATLDWDTLLAPILPKPPS